MRKKVFTSLLILLLVITSVLNTDVIRAYADGEGGSTSTFTVSLQDAGTDTGDGIGVDINFYSDEGGGSPIVSGGSDSLAGTKGNTASKTVTIPEGAASVRISVRDAGKAVAINGNSNNNYSSTKGGELLSIATVTGQTYAFRLEDPATPPADNSQNQSAGTVSFVKNNDQGCTVEYKTDLEGSGWEAAPSSLTATQLTGASKVYVRAIAGSESGKTLDDGEHQNELRINGGTGSSINLTNLDSGDYYFEYSAANQYEVTISFKNNEQGPTVNPGDVVFNITNAQNGSVQYKTNANASWQNVPGTLGPSSLENVTTIYVKANPANGKSFDNGTHQNEIRVNSSGVNTNTDIDIDVLSSDTGYSFTYNSSNQYEVRIAFAGSSQQTSGSHTIDFSDATSVSGGEATYDVGGTNVTLTISGTIPSDSKTVTLADNADIALGDTFESNTMEVNVYEDNGFRTSLIVNGDGHTSLDSLEEGRSLPNNATLKIKIQPKANDGGGGAGGDGGNGGSQNQQPQYPGTPHTSSITASNCSENVEFWINGVEAFQDQNGTSSIKPSVTYNREDNGAVVEFKFSNLINQRYTEIKINGNDYAEYIPDSVAEVLSAMDAAGDTQHIQFTIPVPYSSTYTITAKLADITDSEAATYWPTGNFLWNYSSDSSDADDSIEGGSIQFVNLLYNGVNYDSPSVLDSAHHSYLSWDQRQDGTGGVTLPAGAVLTVKLMPDAGNQLTVFNLNGNTFTPQATPGTYQFVVPRGNFHLQAKFEAVADSVNNTSSKVTSVETFDVPYEDISNTNGTYALKVENSNANTATVNEMKNAAGEGFSIATGGVLNIGVDNVIYKGKPTNAAAYEEPTWTTEVPDLGASAEIKIKVDGSLIPTGTQTVRVIHKGSEGCETVPAIWNPETNEITFYASSFSPYAIATSTGYPCDFNINIDGGADVEFNGDNVPPTVNAIYATHKVYYSFDGTTWSEINTLTGTDENSRPVNMYSDEAWFTWFNVANKIPENYDKHIYIKITIDKAGTYQISREIAAVYEGPNDVTGMQNPYFTISQNKREIVYTFNDITNCPHDLGIALTWPNEGDGSVKEKIESFIYAYSDLNNSGAIDADDMKIGLATELCQKYFWSEGGVLDGYFDIRVPADLKGRITEMTADSDTPAIDASRNTVNLKTFNYKIELGYDHSGQPVVVEGQVFGLPHVDDVLVYAGGNYYIRRVSTDKKPVDYFSDLEDNEQKQLAISVVADFGSSKPLINGNGCGKTENYNPENSSVFTVDVNNDSFVDKLIQYYSSIKGDGNATPGLSASNKFNETVRVVKPSKKYAFIVGEEDEGNSFNAPNIGSDLFCQIGDSMYTDVFVGYKKVVIAPISSSFGIEGMRIDSVELADMSLAAGVNIVHEDEHAEFVVEFNSNYYNRIPLNITYEDNVTKQIIINRTGLVVEYMFLEDTSVNNGTGTRIWLANNSQKNLTYDYNAGEQIAIYAAYYHPIDEKNKTVSLFATKADGSTTVISGTKVNGGGSRDVTATFFLIGYAASKALTPEGTYTGENIDSLDTTSYDLLVVNNGFDSTESFAGTQFGAGKGVHFDGHIEWNYN